MKKYIPMAIAYDFDGTLAPGNMQEHQFIPDIGMKPKKFWAEVNAMTKQHQADEILVYMNLMLKKAANASPPVPVRREDFKKCGKSIALFPGVDKWFARINEYARTKCVKVSHFIVSSGNAEIIAGTPIASQFECIYASKFLFDANGAAMWPALAVNYTTKTQYLFRINKDAHDLSDKKKVNQFVPMEQRPIPFDNIVFIGDGETDIPCFRLVKEQGGLSVAVFKAKTKAAREKALTLIQEGRVHCAAPAIYVEGSELDVIVKANIDAVASRAALKSSFPEHKSCKKPVGKSASADNGIALDVDPHNAKPPCAA